MPTEREAYVIASYIGYKRSWSRAEQQQQIFSKPFDVKPNFNTIILYKHAEDAWAFRRRTWTGRWPPRVGRQGLPPLLAILDGEQSLGGPEPARDWTVWKARYPAVFEETADAE